MRYPIRIHDADELGWMDARGDLYREMCARRRARVGRVLMAVAGNIAGTALGIVCAHLCRLVS